jgi:hypothetical protein
MEKLKKKMKKKHVPKHQSVLIMENPKQFGFPVDFPAMEVSSSCSTRYIIQPYQGASRW